MDNLTKVRTIFYDKLALFIGEEEFQNPEFTSVHIPEKKALNKFLKSYLNEEQFEDLMLYGYQNKFFFRDFKANFRYVRAAGGIVKNKDGKYLFIKRQGMWDLPKGKFERNETPRQCAIREVEEETGVRKIKIKNKLPSTHHIFFTKNGNIILKKTYWYMMESNGKQNLRPQKDEDITKVVWFGPKRAKAALEKSYRSLNDTLSSFITD